MKNVEEIKKTLLYVKQACEIKGCDKCPFWDDDLECRLNSPFGWWIDDWKEQKDA